MITALVSSNSSQNNKTSFSFHGDLLS